MSIAGFIVLILSLAAAIYAVFLFFFSERWGDKHLLDTARKVVLGVFALTTIAVFILLLALFSHDFSLAYVAEYSSTETPGVYLFSALWAGNAGSLLFWAWCLSLFAAIVVIRQDGRTEDLVPQASIILGIVEVFFLILLIFADNPFQQVSPVPSDGLGLKTQLETIGMIFHPPLMLGGFAACAVPFAFGVAALIKKRLNSAWAAAVKPWALAAWLMLGAGNLIGAWWAYAELGWGGYWAWDAVENSGLMPWLVITALSHTLNAQAKKGVFRAWSILLAMLAFGLTIFGTLLSRSDILSSVHSFSQTGISMYFIIFLVIIIGGSAALLIYRRREIREEAAIDEPVSAEAMFLLMDVLLLGATFIIFVGTIFPLVSEAFGGINMSLGQGFFNLAGLPFLLAVILLAGFCALIGWRRPSPALLRTGSAWSAVAAITVLALMLLFGIEEWQALLPVAICVFTISAINFIWLAGIRRYRTSASLGDAPPRHFRWRWKRHAGRIVHLGIAIMAIGVIVSSVYDSQAGATMLPGDSVNFGKYLITYNQAQYSTTDSRITLAANLSVSKNERYIGLFSPATSLGMADESPVSKAAIRSTFLEDLYIIPVDWQQVTLADNTQVIQVSLVVGLNPFIMWIWIGGIILLLGGLVAFWPSIRLAPPTNENPQADTSVV